MPVSPDSFYLSRRARCSPRSDARRLSLASLLPLVGGTLLGGTLLPGRVAHAQTYTYDTTKTLFSTGFGLATGATGSSATTLAFPDASNSADYTATDNFTNAFSLNALSFSNSGNVTLARSTSSNAANQLVFKSNGSTLPTVSLGNAGDLMIGLNLLLSAVTSFTGSGSATISGAITGSGGLTMSGSGTLTLTGANTYTGGTTISAGTLNVGDNANSSSSSSLGAGNATVSQGANLNYFGSSSVGSATINNSGVLSFYDSSAADMATIVNNYGGTVDLSVHSGGLSIASLSGAGTVQLGGNALTIGQDTDSSSTNNLVSGVIRGTGGSLTKIGEGTLTLAAINTYTGGTTINAGNVIVGNSAKVGSVGSLGTGNVTVNGASDLEFYGDSSAGKATIDNSGSLSFNATSSAGSATINNYETLSFDDSSSAGSATINNYSDPSISISLSFNQLSSAGKATINNGGKLDLSGQFHSLSIGSLSGAGAVQLGGNVLTVGGLNKSDTISGVISDGGQNSGTGGSLTKIGTGTLTLTAANTFTGTTTVSAGTLALNAAPGVNANHYGGALVSDLVVSGAGATLVTLQRDQTSNQSAITIGNGGTLTINAAHTSFGEVDLTGNATINGSATDTNALNLVGVTQVTATGTGNTIATPVGLAQNTFNVVNAADTLAISGAINTTTGGTLAKTASGTLTLTGANTYGGGTTIGAGTIVARGTALGTGAASVASGATLSVGEAVNATRTSITTGSLSVSNLAVTEGSATPLLTFNLGASGTNDVLNLTGSGSELTFSGSGTFAIGFASSTGNSLTGGTYTLLTLATPESVTTAPLLTSYQAVPKGNLGTLNGGVFSYITAGANVTGLRFSFTSADALPEPSSLALLLLAPGAVRVPGMIVRRKGRRGQTWR